MIKVYVSSVIDATADGVWQRIRDFNALPLWHPAIADSRTLAAQTWLDLDTLHENTHWTVPLPPQTGNRPTAAANGGPHHAYPSTGSTVSSPQELAS